VYATAKAVGRWRGKRGRVLIIGAHQFKKEVKMGLGGFAKNRKNSMTKKPRRYNVRSNTVTVINVKC